MWRAIKAISQLVVITLGLWGSVAGEIEPTLAFVIMAVVYLGAEGVETLLAATGRQVQRRAVTQLQDELQADDDDQRREPDGGVEVAPLDEQDPLTDDGDTE